MIRKAALVCATVLAMGGMYAHMAATQPEGFGFVPAGGKTLLLGVIASTPARADVLALVSAKKNAADWKTFLKDKARAIPVLGRMTESQLTTLASYLSLAAPIKESMIPKGLDHPAWSQVLPPDGRDLVLNKCQVCHIITVAVTQEKDVRGWRGLLQTPNHKGVIAAEAEQEMLGQYLAINMPIPVEQIPEALRAGGASY